MTTPPTTSPDQALPPGKPPVGTGSAPLVGLLLAVALVGLGVVGVQTLLAALDAVAGPGWVERVVDTADGTAGDSSAVLVVGAAAVVLGLLLLPVALRRRPRRGLALRAGTGVDLRPRDVARVLASTLEDADAVTDLAVRATRRRVRVDATTVATRERTAAVTADLEERAAPALQALAHPPRLTVRVHQAAEE